jgi:hypothetical protein
MAVTAIDAVVADMVFVTELHRLAARNADFRHIGRTINRNDKPKQNRQEKNATKNAQSRDRVRAGMENLGHAQILSSRVGSVSQKTQGQRASVSSGKMEIQDLIQTARGKRTLQEGQNRRRHCSDHHVASKQMRMSMSQSAEKSIRFCFTYETD